MKLREGMALLSTGLVGVLAACGGATGGGPRDAHEGEDIQAPDGTDGVEAGEETAEAEEGPLVVPEGVTGPEMPDLSSWDPGPWDPGPWNAETGDPGHPAEDIPDAQDGPTPDEASLGDPGGPDLPLSDMPLEPDGVTDPGEENGCVLEDLGLPMDLGHGDDATPPDPSDPGGQDLGLQDSGPGDEAVVGPDTADETSPDSGAEDAAADPTDTAVEGVAPVDAADEEAGLVEEAFADMEVALDSDAAPEKEASLSCPPEMVLITAPDGHDFCMDIYEASRSDATADSMGTSPVATSRPGVMPWHVSSMSTAALAEFAAGCTAAGKRMCTADEWFEACNGPDDTLYFFGKSWNPEICNSVDTFCDDWCAEKGISPCNTNENCGYQYYCFHVMPTGSFPDCTNAYGLYDVNGNVWEVVPVDSPRGYQVRGGAFNCAYPSKRFQCTFDAGWDQLYAGFRCCKDPE